MTSSANRNLVLDILVHMDAGDRKNWSTTELEAPLSELGWNQAERMAQDLLASGPVNAIYSSPSLRCRQTLEPLSKQTGLPINVLPNFHETDGFAAISGWEWPGTQGPDPIGSTLRAGKAYAAFQSIREDTSGGRAVLCSHGDIIPAFLALLAGISGSDLPGQVKGRGALYSVDVSDGSISFRSQGPAAGFPT